MNFWKVWKECEPDFYNIFLLLSLSMGYKTCREFINPDVLHPVCFDLLDSPCTDDNTQLCQTNHLVLLCLRMYISHSRPAFIPDYIGGMFLSFINHGVSPANTFNIT